MRVKQIRVGCVAALVCLPSAAQAQGGDVDLYQRLEDMHHTAWTAVDGLAGEPTSMAQTTDGFLWIGTSAGVFRFDGVRFEAYRPERGGMEARAVSSLAAAPGGGLWVGHARGGVTFLGSDGRGTRHSIADGLPIGTVRSVAVDHDGGVWAAAVGGLARLEGGRWQTVRMDWNYRCLSAWKIFVDRRGTLWVGGATPNRIQFLPQGTKRFIDLGVDESAIGFAEIDDSTVVYAPDYDAALRFVRHHADRATMFHTIPDIVSSVLVTDRASAVWVAGGGVSRFRVTRPAVGMAEGMATTPFERFTSADGLAGTTATDLLVDREGTVWVVTETGLNRFRRRNLTWRRDPVGDAGASLVSDGDGEVWLLAYGEPPLRRARDLTPVPGAPARPLDNGHLDPQGRLWLSNLRELVRWDGIRFRRVDPPDTVVARGYPFAVVAMARERAGRLWAAINGSGVFVLDDSVWTFKPILPDRPDWTPVSIAIDAEARAWLAYRDELAMVHEDRVRIFTKDDGLDVGALNTVRVHDRMVWVSGEEGLAILRGDHFFPVRAAGATGLGSVTSVVPTRDGVWLSASAGLVHIPGREVERLAADPERHVRFNVLGIETELPEPVRFARTSRSFQWGAEGADGVVWFVTNSGIARVDPRQILRNPLEPTVAIRSLVADDSVYSIHGAITLPPQTRTLRMEYTALSLVMPERVRFRHNLEGWEDTWHEAGNRREVTYTDLRPGHYTLRVTASNNDGVWNETGAALAFTVAPAWFEAVWFRALVAATLIGSVVAAYRFRIRRISAALAAHYDARLAERTRIARDLHDTLLQTVQGSKIVADDALDRAPDHDTLRRAMERVAQWLGQAADEGRAALHSLRLADGDNDLAASLRRAADDPTRPATMTVSVETRGTPWELHPLVRDEICRIGYEAIHNACRHSGGTRLVICLEYGRDLTLRATDDGVGIDPVIAGSGKSGRFGIRGMRERAATIGADLTVEGTDAGTRVTLVVPGHSAFRVRPTSQLIRHRSRSLL
jgi:signal transduction histidine kinase